MYLNTFDIKLAKVRSVVERKRKVPGGMCPDQRGKRNNHRKISDESINFIKEHINMFPAYISHILESIVKENIYILT